MTPAEVSVIADGWMALRQGDLPRALSASAVALRDYPRSPAAITLSVEAAIASRGWRAGLDAYEQWLANRPVEEFYVLRRVARAVLYDALTTPLDVSLRLDVVNALVQDGETNLLADVPSTDANAAVRAAAGDDRAVAALVAGLGDGPRAMASIEALGHSHSRAAVAPLEQVLHSPRAELRAAAATALGDLDARDAIPRLQALLQDEQLLPRMAAAGSLIRMGDTSANALVSQWFMSDVADVRLKAAQMTASSPDVNWMSQVQRLLTDPDPMIRIGASNLLSKHDPATAAWTLRQLANDRNLAIREEAVRVLPESIAGDFTELRRFLRAADPATRVHAALRIFTLTR
jgi:HEAT repeat protein